MYTILVPCQYNGGKPVRTRHHREWDKVVIRLAGGMTLLKPSKGSWLSKEGILFEERMIPVNVMCTPKQIERIMKFTMKHYRQLAVLAYEISSNVLYMEA